MELKGLQGYSGRTKGEGDSTCRLKIITLRNHGTQGWIDKLLKFSGDQDTDRRDPGVLIEHQRAGVHDVREYKLGNATTVF